MEFVFYSKKIKETALSSDPIFIIGHCRSGTTYLHNLLCQDKQFAYPSTYQCFLPGVFLTGKSFMKSINKRTLPKIRPMDNVKMHPDFPQEEEFAISSLTPLSYYQSLFFPVKMISHFKLFALMESVALKKWECQYLYFLKKVAYSSKGKQLLLKNPVNTVRIKHLLRLFPNAKFIYIYRNTKDVLQSTFKLYNDLLKINSFQLISETDLKENICKIYSETIEQYQKQKELISNSHLIEVNYDEFIHNPFLVTKEIYAKLDINGHDIANRVLENYISEQATYARNIYN